ncbi:helix-turn-helix domain-containing protein [Tumebacillus flagellatus]|uniref:HTH cro/C1-type domain-containing protein n=1 Tax=Tumebacillus flagellatus TaxID=1157490 RepID=A0A074LM17_9BACL|nr:helix-turn-helix transcriptional regulator [Tumebacillus flagellatus]KEO81585.1 hypothetical protein EL26_20080 [Tumebacillus flagellatus]
MSQFASLGSKLKSYREAKGFNQKELAEKSGISPSTVSALENGRFTPSPDLLQRIALALGLPLHDLVDQPTELTVEALLDVARLQLLRREEALALQTIAQIRERGTLLEDQQDELQLLEASARLAQPDRLPALEMLYALVYKLELAAQIDHVFVARVQLALGEGWMQNGDFVTAVHHLKRGLEVMNQLPVPDALVLAQLHHSLSACSHLLRDEDEMSASIAKAAELFHATNSPRSIGEMYRELAQSYHEKNDPVRAARAYQQAVACYEIALHLDWKVRFDGYAAFLTGQPPDVTLAALQKQLEVPLEPLDEALAYTRIGKVHLNLNDLPAAKAAIMKALELSAPHGTTGVYAYAMLVQAEVLLAAGEYDLASETAFAASDLYAQLPFYHTNLKECLRIGKEAVLRMRGGGNG